MVETITIQIGNSDNKLTQQEWSDFILDVTNMIHLSIIATNNPSIHFSGGSEVSKPWQNYCWVFNANKSTTEKIIASLEQIRQMYRQDSVALTIGETKFI